MQNLDRKETQTGVNICIQGIVTCRQEVVTDWSRYIIYVDKD